MLLWKAIRNDGRYKVDRQADHKREVGVQHKRESGKFGEDVEIVVRVPNPLEKRRGHKNMVLGDHQVDCPETPKLMRDDQQHHGKILVDQCSAIGRKAMIDDAPHRHWGVLCGVAQ